MQKIALLYDASQAVLSTFNLDEVLEQILWIVRDYFHISNSAVLLLDPNTDEFFVKASIALENARLYTLEQRRSRQLEAINAIARQTTAVLNLDELLGKVCDLVLRTFPVDHVVVQLLDEERLSVRAHKGKLTPILTRGAALPTGTGMGMRALELGKTVVENEVAFVPHYMASFVETRSEMCVPLIFFGEKLGVLMLESAKPHNFTDEDVTPLESVADICAGAIQNAHYFDKAQQLAYIDGLTDMYNP